MPLAAEGSGRLSTELRDRRELVQPGWVLVLAGWVQGQATFLGAENEDRSRRASRGLISVWQAYLRVLVPETMIQ